MPDAIIRTWGHKDGPVLNHVTIFELYTLSY